MIRVSLESNWPETPLILEMSEFLAEENPSYFWTFINLIHDKLGHDAANNADPLNQYNMGLGLAKEVLASDSRMSLLKFALSLRLYSPTIAMFNQISTEKIGEKSSTCDSFIEISRTGKTSTKENMICNPDQVGQYLESLPVSDSSADCSLIHPAVYKLDHHYSLGVNTLCQPIAILHGQIGSKSFYDFHSLLTQMAADGKLKYYMRHSFKTSANDSFVSISGYGVELAIKSTEYRAVDDTRVKGEESDLTKVLKETEKTEINDVAGFQISTLKQIYPDKQKDLDEFAEYLSEGSKEIANLKIWEMQKLSLQTATKVLSVKKDDPSSDAQLKYLMDLVQNFPMHAKALKNIPVDGDMKKEIERNQQYFLQNLNLSPTDTALFVDGMFYDMDTVDAFTLFHHLKSEIKLIEGLEQIMGRDKRHKIDKLLRLEITGDKSSDQQLQVDIRDSAVIYVNDIENDKQYKSWPASIQDMLRPTYPGMLRNVRKNMYNLVLILDPSKRETHDMLKLSESFYVHKAPLRIGLVFINQNETADGFNDASVAFLNAFNYISQEKSNYEGLSFITDVIAAVEDRDVQPMDVVTHFGLKYPKENSRLVFGPESDYDTGRRLARDFLTKTGLGFSNRALLNGVLLTESHLTADMFEEAVLTEIMRQTPVIQKAVYSRELTDTHDILDWLMSQKNVMPRLNKHVLGSGDQRYLDLTESTVPSGTPLQSLRPSELIAAIQKQLVYVTDGGKKCSPVTVWIVTDLSSEKGRKLLNAAVNHVSENSKFLRIAVIHSRKTPIAQLYEAVIRTVSDQKQLMSILLKLTGEETNSDQIQSGDWITTGIIPEDLKESVKQSLDSSDASLFDSHEMTYKKVFDAGVDSVVINGRVISIPLDETFSVDDFSLIEKYSMANHGDKLLEHLKDGDANECSDSCTKLASVLLSKKSSKSRHDLNFYGEKHSVLTVEPRDSSQPFLDIVAVTEPLTRGAQKLLPLLITLQKVINMRIRLVLNCVDKHADMPVKTFFRYVLDPELKFDTEDQLVKRLAVFSSMPQSALFTLGMVTPENWLVEAIASPYDLDNIHLEEADSNVWADFKLESLLLEGHCFEQSSGNPPRGLQFVLAPRVEDGVYKDSVGDTIVMANLGYFQLKAKPGAWNLALRSGRSSEMYQIASYEGGDLSQSSSAGSHHSAVVLISSFRSNVIKVKVNKKPGFQGKDLLGDTDPETEEEGNSLWGSISSWTAGKKATDADGPGVDDTINIFSLATGHLYERLLRIMILSVMKNTKSKVKFWFLKNYLSPSFKEFLPQMAAEYKFQYELVEYKWPRW